MNKILVTLLFSMFIMFSFSNAHNMQEKCDMNCKHHQQMDGKHCDISKKDKCDCKCKDKCNCKIDMKKENCNCKSGGKCSCKDNCNCKISKEDGKDKCGCGMTVESCKKMMPHCEFRDSKKSDKN